ncbi:MAG: hypothetical protein AAF518_18955 [Spirochaetota bacterium]
MSLKIHTSEENIQFVYQHRFSPITILSFLFFLAFSLAIYKMSLLPEIAATNYQTIYVLIPFDALALFIFLVNAASRTIVSLTPYSFMVKTYPLSLWRFSYSINPNLIRDIKVKTFTDYRNGGIRANIHRLHIITEKKSRYILDDLPLEVLHSIRKRLIIYLGLTSTPLSDKPSDAMLKQIGQWVVLILLLFAILSTLYLLVRLSYEG